MLTNQFGSTLPVFNTGMADTQVLAANANRQKIIYFNPNAAAILYLAYGRQLPYGQCIQLMPGEKWMDDTNATQDLLNIGSNIQAATFVIVETFG